MSGSARESVRTGISIGTAFDGEVLRHPHANGVIAKRIQRTLFNQSCVLAKQNFFQCNSPVAGEGGNVPLHIFAADAPSPSSAFT